MNKLEKIELFVLYMFVLFILSMSLIVYIQTSSVKYYDMVVERTFREGKKDTVQIWDSQELYIGHTKEHINYLGGGPKNRGWDVIDFKYLKKTERKDH